MPHIITLSNSSLEHTAISCLHGLPQISSDPTSPRLQHIVTPADYKPTQTPENQETEELPVGICCLFKFLICLPNRLPTIFPSSKLLTLINQHQGRLDTVFGCCDWRSSLWCSRLIFHMDTEKGEFNFDTKRNVVFPDSLINTHPTATRGDLEVLLLQVESWIKGILPRIPPFLIIVRS